MRIKDVFVLKEAISDLNEGKRFYDNNEMGVGDYFWDTLVSDIESLVVYAGILKKVEGFYQMLSKRFPYAIYYEIKHEMAYVVAVLPLRRDPAWIRRKIMERS